MYMYVYIYIYIHIHIYIYIHTPTYMVERDRRSLGASNVGRGDDTVGNPLRAQISQFELFELKFIDSSCSSLSS